MDSQQHNSDGQVEVVDDNEVPPQYRVEKHTSELGRTRGASGTEMPLLDETTEALNVRCLSIERREELMIK
jgi:hypothetical protein